MRVGILSTLLFFLGLLASTTVVAQNHESCESQLRVTTIRIDRSNRFNVPPKAHHSNHVSAFGAATRLPRANPLQAAKIVPLSELSKKGLAGQVGYQQPLVTSQASPSDPPLMRRSILEVPPGQLEVVTDSRYEILDYQDARYPSSEYEFIESDIQISPSYRQTTGFCRYHHQNNPFCPSRKGCGDTSSCCDEWSGFGECFGLSSFRYCFKKDCFYGVGCAHRRARQDGCQSGCQPGLCGERGFGCTAR